MKAVVEMNSIILLYFNLFFVVDFLSAHFIFQYRRRVGKPTESETNVIAPIHYAHDIYPLL